MDQVEREWKQASLSSGTSAPHWSCVVFIVLLSAVVLHSVIPLSNLP